MYTANKRDDGGTSTCASLSKHSNISLVYKYNMPKFNVATLNKY